ncbi:MAG: hypothetical protein LBH04_04445 [Tannerellaceae bacterium]|nr:hypothetical protein [Tannerellaceae bacterium]
MTNKHCSKEIDIRTPHKSPQQTSAPPSAIMPKAAIPILPPSPQKP